MSELTWKTVARNRWDIFVAALMLLFLFWMPGYMATTMVGTSFRQEYSEYLDAWRALAIMFYAGDFMNRDTLREDFE